AWIRIRLPKAGQDQTGAQTAQKARLTWVGVNASRVIQAVRLDNERLGVATGAPNQAYKVANTPVIVCDVSDLDSTSDITSTFILQVQNDDNGWDTWQMTDDLYAAKPDDQVYTLDPEAGVVTFGDGLRGKRPPIGKTIRVQTYEYGGGIAGKVAIGAINK